MSHAKNALDKDLMFQKIMPSSKDRNVCSEEESEEDAAGGSLRARIFAQSEASMSAMSGIHVINLMEEVVMQHLDDTIEKFNCCRCDQCRSDIIAITLNELPPKYVVGDPKHAKELAKQVSTKEVLSALVRAVIKVRSHPRH
ncbi:MAG TPA: hypothetical protein DHW78_01520 [Ruminococcaceae bacterium]|jgi:predicted transcriptional regulator|nr:late competence development ComFB family protein [Oscillospiraceae bacterium]HCC02240.1 hypothetical protein [Oscillospiraceae bacterium]HCM22995.1 hypothetical protein [Oscillospiraceae bacterium]